MGGVLEVGKIVTAVWLHRNWKTSPFLIKSYLSFATITLMAITSMGIFGFLSKAHIEHQTITDKAIASAQVIQNKIDREKDFVLRQQEHISDLQDSSDKKTSNSRIDIDSENQKIRDITEQMNKDILFEQNRISEQNEKLLKLNTEIQELESSKSGIFSNKKKKIEELKETQKQPRAYISENISKYNQNIDRFRETASQKTKAIEDKITSFRTQSDQKDTSTQPQIDTHTRNISEAHGRIDALETEKIGFSDSARQLEAEVGPVKYVAEAIADFTGKEFNISQAVRIVIIILVLVFDPLAILLVIAANISIEKYFPHSAKSKKTTINIDRLIKEQSQLEESVNQLNKDIEEKNIEHENISSKIELDTKNQKSSNAEIKKLTIEAEAKQKTLLEDNKNIEEEIAKNQLLLESINKKASEISNEVEKISDDNELKKIKLEKDAESLKIKQQAIEVAAAINKDKEIKLSEKIKNKEEILEHLESEKKKYLQEKISLESQNSTLQKSIETQKKLLTELQKSYKTAVKSNDLKGVFDHYSIDETTKTLEDGQEIVTIKDKKGRVHQFIMPAKLAKDSRVSLYSIVKDFMNITDEDDLAHEFEIIKTKYYRNIFPQYNFLT